MNKQEIMARYPEAAEEVKGIWVEGNDPALLAKIERYAAAHAIRHEREREAGEIGRTSAARQRNQIREANRARYEYGLPFDIHSYTPLDERGEDG